MNIHVLLDKFEVVSWMYEMRCVAKFATRLTKKKAFYLCFFIYIFVSVCVCGDDFN